MRMHGEIYVLCDFCRIRRYLEISIGINSHQTLIARARRDAADRAPSA